jgi:hypothetical protein
MARLLWQQRQDIGPAARLAPAMAYIEATARTLLFGGMAADGDLGDTWEWDGDGWVQVADTGPSPRHDAKLAYDSARNVAVLFGFGGTAQKPDTWEWDGEVWTQVADSGPNVSSPTCGMAYDGARQITVLETGSVGSRGQGTWRWDGATWTEVADTGPARRAHFPLAFDPVRQRVVLFGGWDDGPTFLGDTWEWDGAAWRQVQDIGPSPRYGHAMAWFGDAVGLFGGDDAPTLAPRGDTWTWDGKHWRQRQDIGPPGRMNSAIAWDAARGRAVLFGGRSVSDGLSVMLGDTWEAFEEP